MDVNAQQVQAELALELDRQKREMRESAEKGHFGLRDVSALICPLALIAFALLVKGLSENERLIALGAGVGLLSLYGVFQFEMSRRTRVLLNLLERRTGEAR